MAMTHATSFPRRLFQTLRVVPLSWNTGKTCVLVICCELTTFSDVSIVSLFGGVKTCTFSKRCLQSPGMHALGGVGWVIDVVYLFTFIESCKFWNNAVIYRVPLVLSSMISNTKSMIFSDERLLLVHLRRLLSPFYATQKN